MGRHSLPDDGARGTRGRARAAARRRTVALATALVLAVAAGTAIAVTARTAVLRRSCEAIRRAAGSGRLARCGARRPGRRRPGPQGEDHLGRLLHGRPGDRPRLLQGRRFVRFAPPNPTSRCGSPTPRCWVDRAKDAIGERPAHRGGTWPPRPSTLAAVPASAAARSAGRRRPTRWAEVATAATARDASCASASADPARSASGLLALSCIGKSAASAGRPAAAPGPPPSPNCSRGGSPTSDGQVPDTLARTTRRRSGNPRRNQARGALRAGGVRVQRRARRGPGGCDSSIRRTARRSSTIRTPWSARPGMSTDESRAAMRFIDPARRSRVRRASWPRRASVRPAGRRTVRVASAAGGSSPQPYGSATRDHRPAPRASRRRSACGDHGAERPADDGGGRLGFDGGARAGPRGPDPDGRHQSRAAPGSGAFHAPRTRSACGSSATTSTAPSDYR